MDKSGWIAIDKRLPRDYGQYLVCGPIGIFIAWWNNESWEDSDGDEYWNDLTCYFTHWMPLPDMPTKEE